MQRLAPSIVTITVLAIVIPAFSTSLSAGKAKMPEPIMLEKGETVISKSFESASEVDKKSMAFRKLTQDEVQDGVMHALPPSIALKGKKSDSQWATSTFARAGLLNVPAEFVAQFRWKYNRPSDAKLRKTGLAYIDLGHRCIRVTMTPEGSVLVLENHLVGREERLSIVLQEVPNLKLQAEKWYDVTVEVKGEEVVFQIDGQVLYGRHPLIAKERYDKFNIDVDGAGFVWDEVTIWAAGDYRSDWEGEREKLSI
ncbi:MAG TPA: hypothetical protein DIV79_16740 [Opitutae bacterium]|nr:hypothetical protein [Opitutaceae bacterium]HCR31652.1 hypothetical protein [Opitutae bacterium]|tara:strand:+ start:391 stop:1152 length:762 start_codon:yes stop_codon:yes gene_type:complete